MATCKRISIDRSRVCRGDLNSVISLLKREIQGVSIGDIEASEDFTVVDTPFAGIKTLGSSGESSRGVRRFAGVNISKETTHLFFVQYADLYVTIETGNHFILHDGKYYRIIAINNLNELNLTVMYQCTERGDSTKEATEA